MIAAIVAPALGGTLAALIGAANVISIDAVSVLLSALLLAIIPRAFNQARAVEPARGSPFCGAAAGADYDPGRRRQQL